MNKKLFFSLIALLTGIISLETLAGGERYGLCQYYWLWGSLGVILWLGLASILLFYTWNNVIVSLFSAKKATFWQALLVVALIATFCTPHYFAKKQKRKI